MESSQNSTDNLQEVFNINKKNISTERINCLYPNGHRMTHQLKWFKSSFVNSILSDISE